jgi:hypothetical protein
MVAARSATRLKSSGGGGGAGFRFYLSVVVELSSLAHMVSTARASAPNHSLQRTRRQCREVQFRCAARR